MIDTILYALATTTLLAMIGALAERFAELRGWARRWLWVAVLLAAVACVLTIPLRDRAIAAVPLPPVAVRPAAAPTPAPARTARLTNGAAEPTGGAANPVVRRNADPSETLGGALSADRLVRVLWGASSLVLLVSYLASSMVLASRRRRWRATDVDNASVLVSGEDGPAVIGLLHPAIVLPEWAMRIDPAPRSLMIEHELEHVRARDPLVVHGGLAALVLMPWNVALWWIVRRLRLATELDCDARVLRRGNASVRDVATYSDLLLSVAERRSFGYFSGAPALVERRSMLRRRLIALRPRTFARPALQAGLAAAGIAVLLAVTAAAPPPLRQSTWRIDPKPVFDVGAESLDTLDTFGDVVGAARVANGEIAVADAKYFSIRFFSPDGKFRHSVGRRGEGPGEFTSITRMMRCGDSLFVADRSQVVHWSVFAATGVYKRTYAPAAVQPRYQSAYGMKCNDRGIFINDGWENPTDRKIGVFRSSIPFWISNPDGSVRAQLGDHASGERVGRETNGRIGTTGPRPLGKQPVLAIGRTRAYVGTADSFAVLAFALDGTPLATVRKANVNLKTTPADIERVILFDTAGKSPASVAQELAWDRLVPFPITIPAYRDLVVDSDDNLWVQRYPRAGEPGSHWVVFSPAGNEIAQVDLPSNLKVEEIGRDYVLGIATELPDGVHHVKVYRLKR